MPHPVTHLDDRRLPEWGYGVTNIVGRPSPGIDTLLREEYVQGRVQVMRKALRYRPEIVALVGVTVFRALFPERRGVVALGLQPERIRDSRIFVLPNPSGRNAHYSYAAMLEAFTKLRRLSARLTLSSNCD